jgi:peptide/nickel transport system permease protein
VTKGPLKASRLVKRVGSRLIVGVGVLWAAATLAFVALHSTAGDAALSTVAGQGANPTKAVLDQVRKDYGLDLPLWRQYVDYLGKLVRGNLGESYQQRVPVAHAISEQLMPTFELAACAAVIALVLSVVTATLTAKRRQWVRSSSNGIEMVLASMPTFVLGLLLMIVFAIELKVFPISGQDGIKALVLPAVTLSLPIAAVLTQVLRAELEDVLEQPFVVTARSRGMSDARVRFGHALRHGVIPLITLSGYMIGFLLGGAVITESLFNRQGLGQLMLTATTNKDIPLVIGLIMFAALVYVVVNLVVDILYTVIDPRVITR